MTLGEKIRSLRLSKNLTLQKLSEKVDISVSFLSDIEHNRSKPSLARLKEISAGLNTCVSCLLEEESWISTYLVETQYQLYNPLCPNDLENAEWHKKILSELSKIKTWPNDEKLTLLNYIQEKNSQLLSK